MWLVGLNTLLAGASLGDWIVQTDEVIGADTAHQLIPLAFVNHPVPANRLDRCSGHSLDNIVERRASDRAFSASYSKFDRHQIFSLDSVGKRGTIQ